jgi:hypothetical protein
MTLRYGQLLFFVQSMLRGFSLTRQRNLALLALGISRVRDGHLTLSEIARSVPTRSDHWVKFKRIQRFVASTRWSPAELFPRMLGYVLERFSPGHYLPLIIDQSTLAGRWEVLWASLPFRGRALPIAFRLFRYEDIAQGRERSQNAIEEGFLRQVVGMLPHPDRTILLLDRGYARVSLFRLLDGLGVRYVVRVRRNVWVQHPRHTGCLRDVSVAKGVQLWWPQVAYHQTARYRVNLAITRNAAAEEPWYLVTNLSRAETAVRHYEMRFRCEELFRDLKDQLHLEAIRLRLEHPERVAKLLLGMMVLYYALTLLGAEVQKRGLRKKVCKDKVSLAFLALRALQMSWLLTYERIIQALFHSCWSLAYKSG